MTNDFKLFRGSKKILSRQTGKERTRNLDVEKMIDQEASIESRL